MFIVTARVPRRRLLAAGVTALCCLAVVATALLLTLSGRAVTTSAEVAHIRTNEDRIAYLNQLGWQVGQEPALTEELLIPAQFDESYTQYLALQTAQGFDLERYCGKRIKRYLYDVENYPQGEVGVQAALLVYRNKVIGGQLQAVDGSFILPLTGEQ